MQVLEDHTIAPPLQFPNPAVKRCAVGRLVIRTEDGRSMEKQVMESENGNFYEIGRLLKESIFGQVNHSIGLTRGPQGLLIRDVPIRQYAMKIYLKTRLRQYQGQTQENPGKEIAAMQFMRNLGGHDNIVNQVECCTDAEHVFSIMEFCDGEELYDVVEAQGPMDEARARFYFRQIYKATFHLHSWHIGHRDLTLENVMTCRNGNCKIIDFGMCLLSNRSGSGKPLLMPPQGRCGKKNYIAPEVLENTANFSPHGADVWSLGVMLFILVTGVPPVETATPMDPRFRMICSGQLGEMLQQWGITLSSSVIDLLSRLLRQSPHERIALEQLQDHEWMQSSDSSPVN